MVGVPAVADDLREGKPPAGHAPPHGIRHPRLTARASPAYLTHHETERLAVRAGRARAPPTPRVMRASQTRGAAAAVRTIVLTTVLVGLAGKVQAEPAVVVDSDQFGNVFQEGERAELTIRWPHNRSL